MKKTSPNKNLTTKKAQKYKAKPIPVSTKSTAVNRTRSGALYVYWVLILFFVASTFYILGHVQGEEKIKKSVSGAVVEQVVDTQGSVQQISEEKLKTQQDFYNNGKAKLVAGQLEDAIADLTAAIDAGAGVDAYILRGEAYMQSGDYRNAMENFNMALERDSESAVAYYDRALLNIRLENNSDALNDINNAMAANSKNPTPVLQLRDLYAKRGQLNLWNKNWEGAIADYTNSLARPEGVVSPSVYAERAEAYTALGNYEEAINDYSSAVRVISEQIQGAPTVGERESLSIRAMEYFEKSAALNVKLGDYVAARNDLQSSRTIAVALKDVETIARLDNLLTEMSEK